MRIQRICLISFVTIYRTLCTNAFILGRSVRDRIFHARAITSPFSWHAWRALLREIELDPLNILSQEDYNLIEKLVQERASARWDGNYEKADLLRGVLDKVDMPDGCALVLQDIPRNQGGGSTWSLVYRVVGDLQSTSNAASGSFIDRSNVLQLAHAALGRAISSSVRPGVKVDCTETSLDLIVEATILKLRSWKRVHDIILNLESSAKVDTDGDQELFGVIQGNIAESCLTDHWKQVETSLRGRKPADAAFWFALAGVANEELFSLLADVCIKELNRFGSRPSCRGKDIWAVADRLAAAGMTAIDFPHLYDVIVNSLLEKGAALEIQENVLRLHSERCALMIWKFSTKQKKQKVFLETAARHWQQQVTVKASMSTTPVVESEELMWSFDDPSKPLVIDIGCGMGVSLLGLASVADSASYPWHDCNFLGVDLSSVAISYAKGIAKRWRLESRLAFVVDSAEHCLEYIKSHYPGPIKRILIQFPTPYRLPSTEVGNSQLPASSLEGFMVSVSLLKLSSDLLKSGGGRGDLMLQSNCEDVAVWMQQTACREASLAVVNLDSPLLEPVGSPTQRTLNWVALGGERAVGKGWSSIPLLPPTGRTETEIACILNRTPVHRCILRPKNEAQ